MAKGDLWKAKKAGQKAAQNWKAGKKPKNPNRPKTIRKRHQG